MTWLDSYEEQMQGLGLTREMRMARVIRELVDGLQILKELTLQEEYRMTDDQTVDMWNYFANLSPDAKEVIDDCTAPSSN